MNEGEGYHLNQGAGDQGFMFATPRRDSYPDAVAIYYSHRLMQRQSELRKDGRLPWLRPSQSAADRGLRQRNRKVKRIDTVSCPPSTIRLSITKS
ncbi:hypothetical protein [Neisseria subflava]|uniref:hypothetical protein n=1 Tax=Neisseria subflava TaxID=28449 RepID=UPI0020B6B4DB|nr:hypothetical protein [Neisseria subflava]